jgi:hypothetical protein
MDAAAVAGRTGGDASPEFEQTPERFAISGEFARRLSVGPADKIIPAESTSRRQDHYKACTPQHLPHGLPP